MQELPDVVDSVAPSPRTRGRYFVFFVLLILVLAVSCIPYTTHKSQHHRAVAPNGSYQVVGELRGIGGVRNSLVGPAASSQKYYISYMYGQYSLRLVAIDPTNNYAATSYKSPVKTELGAYGMAVASDNNLYLGTVSRANAHILKFDTTSSQFTDAGVVPVDPASSTKQTYVWELTLSQYDKKLYGCTYPSADLISYAPSNGQIANLGRMDASNQYARHCTADPQYPYVYIGTGSVGQKIVAYDIRTRTKKDLATSPASGFADTWLGRDGKAYGSVVKPDGTRQTYLLSNGTATVSTTARGRPATNVFSNGDRINISDNNASIIITNPDKSKDRYPYTYTGGRIGIFRVGTGPKRSIYTSGYIPFYLAKHVPANPASGVSLVGRLGDGEAYSFLAHNNKLAMSAYAAGASLLYYDPTIPISPKPYRPPNCSGNPQPNPQCVRNLPDLWRPKALISAPNGMLYAGSIGADGELKGYLVEWDPQVVNTASTYRPYANLGITSLTAANSCQGVTAVATCLVGGTSINGGSGTTPSAQNSRLFVWDTAKDAIVQDMTIPNVSKVREITNLITHPVNKYVYGIAISSTGNYLFIFDPTTGDFINGGTRLSFAGGIDNSLYNSMGVGSDNNIWGLTNSGIFTIDIKTGTAQLASTAPKRITAGYSLVKDPAGDRIYFASKANLYRYTASN